MTTREENMSRREQKFDADAEIIITEATRYMETAQEQTKRAIKAWTEVTMVKLKDVIDTYHNMQKDRTDEFCKEQL